ncbi:hypothetical protein Poly41_52570 [Novipirellula artificiosorum]|uniref:Uncharacterized protein n=1 Tax=Novipirellula artificiosorum TaxID=2528016 RepID=A0A5C6D7T3_9BACT|nr:hypothetical protein Poly41_52570 [Novipirellula artificiosorum]
MANLLGYRTFVRSITAKRLNSEAQGRGEAAHPGLMAAIHHVKTPKVFDKHARHPRSTW